MQRGTTVFPAVVAVLVLVVLASSAVELWFEHAATTGCRNKIPTDVWTLHFATEAYARDHGGCPPATLEDLVRPDPALGGATYLRGSKLPMDPWGQPYLFEPSLGPGDGLRVFTLGRDREPGGEGFDADFDDTMRGWGDTGDADDHSQ